MLSILKSDKGENVLYKVLKEQTQQLFFFIKICI